MTCQYDVQCQAIAAYEIRYGFLDEIFLLCVDHTAEMRANDPHEHIDSVRSLRRSEVKS